MTLHRKWLGEHRHQLWQIRARPLTHTHTISDPPRYIIGLVGNYLYRDLSPQPINPLLLGSLYTPSVSDVER